MVQPELISGKKMRNATSALRPLAACSGAVCLFAVAVLGVGFAVFVNQDLIAGGRRPPRVDLVNGTIWNEGLVSFWGFE